MEPKWFNKKVDFENASYEEDYIAQIDKYAFNMY